MLPNNDDDPVTVAIFAGSNDNKDVNIKQNGDIGTSLFGNIMIQVNLLIKGYEDWIKYVFAHKYHHTVWGNYWFNLHGGELQNKLIDSLVIDGEADSFALELYPELNRNDCSEWQKKRSMLFGKAGINHCYEHRC